jgi:hypothetical protein
MEKFDEIQDWTIADATDFWQAVMSIGNVMHGENRAVEQRQLRGLSERLNKWFSDHPEITIGGSLDDFAMCAVHDLINALVFNSMMAESLNTLRRRSRELRG